MHTTACRATPRALLDIMKAILYLSLLLTYTSMPRMWARAHATHADTAMRLYPWVSEVMASPLAGASEYIELFNPHDAPLSLEGLSLELGSRPDRLVSYALDGLPELSAQSYLVLTSSPQGVVDYYPEADPSLVVQWPMPRLNNASCYIVLCRGSQVIDSLCYSPSLKDRGVRSKRGVALERTAWVAHTGQSGLWRSALEPHYATPTRSRVSASHPSPVAEGEASLSHLIAHLEADSPQQAEVVLYTMAGLRYAHLDGSQALEWLRLLHRDARSALARLSSPHRRGWIVHIRLLFATGMEQFALKLVV